MKLRDLFKRSTGGNGNGSPTQVRRKQQLRHVRELYGKADVNLRGGFGWGRLGIGHLFDIPASGADWDSPVGTSLQRKNAIIYSCVEELASSTAEATLEIGLEEDGNFRVIDNHSALDFFYDNPDYSYNVLIRLMVVRLAMTGATFSLLGKFEDRGTTGEFTPLPTQMITIRGNGPTIKGYTLHRANQQPKNLEPDEVSGIWYPDPAVFQGWISPLGAAARDIAIDRERGELTRQVLRNRKIPGGFLQFGKDSPQKNLTEKQRDQLKESIDAAIGGETMSRGKMLFLPGGLQYAKGIEVSDINFEFVNALAETRICMIFGVPPILIGSKAGLDKATYANYGEARKSFYKETLNSLWAFIASGLTRSIDLGDDRLEFRFNTSEITELQEDIDKRAERAEKLFKARIATRNEARDMVNLPPVEGDAGGEFAPQAPNPLALPAPAEDKKSHLDKYSAKDTAPIGSYPESGLMERALQRFFKKQGEEVRKFVKRTSMAPEFAQWDDELIDVLLGPLGDIWLAKLRGALREIQAKTASAEFKGKQAFESVEAGLEVIRPEVLLALEKQLIRYAKSVNKTTAGQLDKSMKSVVEVAATTNTPADLTKAVQETFGFAEEWRARRVAITESSRAVHDSKVAAAAASGQVKGLRIDIADDACDICQYYDGPTPTRVPVVPYTDINAASAQIGEYGGKFPPFHPNCRCSFDFVFIDEDPPPVQEIPGTWRHRPRPKLKERRDQKTSEESMQERLKRMIGENRRAAKKAKERNDREVLKDLNAINLTMTELLGEAEMLGA